MSHHLDWPTVQQDVSDVHCFAGPSDADGPRTVIGMNTSPLGGVPWDPGNVTLYELKLDLNDDLVEDITYRFTFSDPDPSTGIQYWQIAQLTGKEATSRTAPGTVITPPNLPEGQAVDLPGGIKAFAGKRLDSFFTDIRVPVHIRSVLPPGPNAPLQSPTADPMLGSFSPYNDNEFMGTNVRLVMVELPASITGLNPIQCWGSTAVWGHGEWTQVQRAAGADTSVVFDNGNDPYHQKINRTGPSEDLVGRPVNPETDPASGVWGTVRDQIATVVETLGTYNQGVNGRPTPLAYGAWAADTLLPNVLRFTPGTTAGWDPWNGVLNGKGLFEDLAQNFARMVINMDFTSKLTQPGAITPYFPYLAPAD